MNRSLRSNRPTKTAAQVTTNRSRPRAAAVLTGALMTAIVGLATANGASATDLDPATATSPSGTDLDLATATSPSGTDIREETIQPSSEPAQATRTTLSASASSSTFGSRVGLFATVSPDPGGGVVRFVTNGGAIPGCESRPVVYDESLRSSRATCWTSTLPVGSHSVRAMFLGTSKYERSYSAPLGLVITKALTSVTVSCSPNPVRYGEEAKCTARVSNSDTTPGGKVTWSTSGNGYFVSTGCELNAGTCSVPYKPSAMDVGATGSITISADYVGTTNYKASSATAQLAVR